MTDPLPPEHGSSGPPESPRRSGPPQKQPGDGLRLAASTIGQTLVTAGVVILLFVVYELYITDIFGHEKQAKATTALDQLWERGGGAGDPVARSGSTPSTSGAANGTATGGAGGTKVVTVTSPNRVVTSGGARQANYEKFVDGQGFAKIYIPSFGSDYVFTLIEGISTDDLYAGPGHYPGTQYPGDPGNFSVAGHRVSKGSPFNELGLLSSCDAMVIETQTSWFVYRVLPMANEVAGWTAAQHPHCAGVSAQAGAYAQTFGRVITVPSDYAQVLPVPEVDSTTVPAGAEHLITLTTCHPQFSDTQRMVIHGVLVKTYPKSTGFLPPELKES